MQNSKSLKALVQDVFARFNYGDFQPGKDSTRSQFANIIASDNTYWKKLELGEGLDNHWISIVMAHPTGNGLVITFEFSSEAVKATIHNGVSGRRFVEPKAVLELPLLEAYLDHQKIAEWFLQMVERALRYGFSQNKDQISWKF